MGGLAANLYKGLRGWGNKFANTHLVNYCTTVFCSWTEPSVSVFCATGKLLWFTGHYYLKEISVDFLKLYFYTFFTAYILHHATCIFYVDCSFLSFTIYLIFSQSIYVIWYKWFQSFRRSNAKINKWTKSQNEIKWAGRIKAQQIKEKGV